MFVEKLTKKQILDFVKTLEDYEKVVDIFIVKEACFTGHIFFTVDFPDTSKSGIQLTITANDIKFAFKKNEDWIKYLYSIFGEEYKLWYKKQQEEEFNRLFADNK